MNNELVLWNLAFGPANGQDSLGDRVDKPTDVFRLEVPSGKGVFNAYPDDRARSLAAYEVLADFGADRLANKNNERMGLTGLAFHKKFGAAHYGCDTLEALDDWFSVECRKWCRRALGARLVQYQVQPGQSILPIGHGEVIFAKPLAHRVGLRDIVKFNPIKGE